MNAVPLSFWELCRLFETGPEKRLEQGCDLAVRVNCCVLRWSLWRCRLLLSCGSWYLCLCLWGNPILVVVVDVGDVEGEIVVASEGGYDDCERHFSVNFDTVSVYCVEIRCCRRGVIGVDERWFDDWYHWSSVGDESRLLWVNLGGKADANRIPNRCRAHEWGYSFPVRRVIVREMMIRYVRALVQATYTRAYNVWRS